MKFRQCPEQCCTANVNGKCAVPACGGPIVISSSSKKMDWDPVKAANFYTYFKYMFRDYFEEEATP